MPILHQEDGYGWLFQAGRGSGGSFSSKRLTNGKSRCRSFSVIHTYGAEIMLVDMTGFLEQIAVSRPDDAEAYDEEVHGEMSDY